MQQREGQFTGAGGKSVFYSYWFPQQDARALILLVHGAGEHSGRYQQLANHLVSHGYVVAALDHIGHGRSEGRYGFIEQFDDHLQTLGIFERQASEDFPGLPKILLGHSMGGLIAANFLLQHQQQFVACILSGAAIRTDIEPGPVQLGLIRLLSLLLPRVGVLQLDAAGVSRDPNEVQRYVEDPLVHHGKMSARMVAELFRWMTHIQENAAQISLPILILHGGADVMTAPAGSEFLYGAVSSPDKRLKIYPGLYHEIFNEPEREQVYADVLDWCEAHL